MGKGIGQKPNPLTIEWLNQILQDTGYVIAQAKLDGVHLVWNGKKLLLPSGAEATGLPEAAEELAMNFTGEKPEAEAFCVGMDPRTVAGIARRPASNLDPRRDRVKLWLFDLAEPDVLQHERLIILTDLMDAAGVTKHIQLLPSVPCSNENAVEVLLVNAMLHDMEGLVLRHPYGLWKRGYNADLRKIKPGGRDSYTIVGYGHDPHVPDVLHSIIVEGQGGRMTLLYLPLYLPFNEEKRRKLWRLRRDLLGRRAVVRYSLPPKPGEDAPFLVSALVSIEGIEGMEMEKAA